MGRGMAFRVGIPVESGMPMGKVIFDGNVLLDQRMKCTKSDSKIFKMNRQRK